MGDSLQSERSSRELPGGRRATCPGSHDATGQLPSEDGGRLRPALHGGHYDQQGTSVSFTETLQTSFLVLQIAQIQMQNDISMFVFLPDEVTTNTTLLEESLTAEFVQDLSMALQPAQVTLTLPVLRLSYSTDLLPLLGDLGESESTSNILRSNLTHRSAEGNFDCVCATTFLLNVNIQCKCKGCVSCQHVIPWESVFSQLPQTHHSSLPRSF